MAERPLGDHGDYERRPPRPTDSEARPLTANERALLDALLTADVDGGDALREQAKAVLARPGCACGCGTIDLLPRGDPPRSPAPNPWPSEGRVRDENGRERGGLVLFLRNGLLASLEVYSYSEPLPLPLLRDVQLVHG